MGPGRRDRELILAEHGRLIANLSSDVQVLEQNLRSFGRRLSMLEASVVELTKLHDRLDVGMALLNDEVRKLAARARITGETSAEGEVNGQRARPSGARR